MNFCISYRSAHDMVASSSLVALITHTVTGVENYRYQPPPPLYKRKQTEEFHDLDPLGSICLGCSCSATAGTGPGLLHCSCSIRQNERTVSAKSLEGQGGHNAAIRRGCLFQPGSTDDPVAVLRSAASCLSRGKPLLLPKKKRRVSVHKSFGGSRVPGL
jgi:hypothetical protein